MKLKTIETYEYKELPEKIQEKILEKLYDINTDYEWYDCEIDHQKEKLETLGFNNAEIAFNISYSQGDGASFTTNDIDIKKYIIETKQQEKYPLILASFEDRAEYDQPTASIDRTEYHLYVHENTIEVSINDNDYQDEAPQGYQDEVLALEEEMQEHIIELSQEIHTDLTAEYEELTSDEAIIDTIEANGYTFDEKGEIA